MTNIEFAESLRQMADFYAANPEMPQPDRIEVGIWQRDKFLRAVHLAGSVTKIPFTVTDEYFYRVRRDFSGLALELVTSRADICRRVKKTVEVETWECPDSLLEQIAALEDDDAQN